MEELKGGKEVEAEAAKAKGAHQRQKEQGGRGRRSITDQWRLRGAGEARLILHISCQVE